jgi:hypothetical protein
MSEPAEIETIEGKFRRVEVRMSDRELRLIDASAQKTGLNRSEYLRVRGLKRVYTKVRPLPSPDYENLMLNYRELRAQGNNLNQMTKAIHLAKFTGGSVVIDRSELRAAVEANNRATQAILKIVE